MTETSAFGERSLSPTQKRGGPTSLVLVRHAATPWTRSQQHTGRTDVPLDKAGREQAIALGPRLQAYGATAVLSSPLSRALETCRLAGLGEHVEVTDLLLEWDYGDYEGRTTAEVHEERPGWSLFHDGSPRGELAADVGRRVDLLLAELASRPDGGVAVLFAHGHLLRVVAARWVGLEPEAGAFFVLGAPSISELGFERERHVIQHWNT